MSYGEQLSKLFKDTKTAIIVIIFTIARVWYGWHWVQAGFEKATTWFGDGKANSAGLIKGMVGNLAKSHGPDPLHFNDLLSWAANNIFLNMQGLTDFLVVFFEIAVGLVILLGFKVFWGALVGMFLNTQFAAAGSANNFGYIWTNLILMKWAKYFEVIGIDGFLRSKKGQDLL